MVNDDGGNQGGGRKSDVVAVEFWMTNQLVAVPLTGTGGKYTEGKTPDKGENNSSVTGPEIIYWPRKYWLGLEFVFELGFC